jgi:dephospho-CoA kinase
MKNFVSNQPIILGLSGKAGSGKTSVAESIIPKGSMETVKFGINWDHIFYALPLYEMASIKKNIIGFNEESRKLYSLHEVLYEVYGGSSIGNMPHYDILIEKVKQIYNTPVEEEGIKPRTFLQKAGDICREYDANCFSNWAIIKANKIYRNYLKNHDEDNINPMCVIVSDVRYLNEAKNILKQPNGFVISFDADKEVLDERILKRDGAIMNSEQSGHSSEMEAEQVKQVASAIIDTNNMDLKQQVAATLECLGIGIKNNA